MSAESLISTHGVPVDVQRRVSTIGSAGEELSVWGPIASERMFLQPSGASRGDTYGAQRNSEQYRVFARAGADIRIDDRLVYDVGPNKRTLHVTGLTRPGEKSSGRLSRLEIDAYEEFPRG